MARRPGTEWTSTEGREWAYVAFAPLGLASLSDPFYDEYDVRSFDSRAKHAAALDEDREPSFGDS